MAGSTANASMLNVYESIACADGCNLCTVQKLANSRILWVLIFNSVRPVRGTLAVCVLCGSPSWIDRDFVGIVGKDLVLGAGNLGISEEYVDQLLGGFTLTRRNKCPQIG